MFLRLLSTVIVVLVRGVDQQLMRWLTTFRVVNYASANRVISGLLSVRVHSSLAFLFVMRCCLMS